MKIRSARILTSAPDAQSSPPEQGPEFAFIGRSNVGKSSLINLLSNQPGLARVSATPGKTRMLHFFLIDESWILTDLPGYGYAKTSRTEAFDFNQAVGDYLERRASLRGIFVLIDSRLEPQRIDLDFLEWLSSTGRRHSLVFTKADKQSPTRTAAASQAFLQALAQRGIRPPEHIFTTSTRQPATRLPLLRHIQATIQGKTSPTP
jgi:GTP-binding protein